MRKLLLRCLFCIFVICSSSCYAMAATGDIMSDPVKITFGSTYTKSWNKDTDHLNHYCEFQLDSRGIVNITATKPYDSDQEYGSLKFMIYDEDGEAIWSNYTYYAKDSATSSYNIYVGLNEGLYYMTLQPGFYVTSGTIDTSFSLNFEPTMYCEVEPNDGQSTATKLTLGHTYKGFWGSDGSSDYENADYYKVYLEAGESYKIAIGNYTKLEGTTTIIKWLRPDGSEYSYFSHIEDKVDDEDNNYLMYSPNDTGYFYLKIYNYHKQQLKYTVCVSEQERETQTITTAVNNTITKNKGDSYFELGAKAKTSLSYKSSNTEVVTVSSGTVFIEGYGKAIITITAKQSDTYKEAKKKITVYVKPKKNAIKSLTNDTKKTLTVTWNTDYNADGYQVQIATDSKFEKNKKSYTVKGYSSKSKDIKKLTKGKKYYVRLRAYGIDYDGNKVYGPWSKTKYKKITK